MVKRVQQHQPPVTEAEFQALAGWLRAQDAAGVFRLEHVFALGGGRQTSVGYLRYGLAQGPRVLGVTEMVEDLRQIQAQYAAPGNRE
jgi:hypothetical protein